jgi:hypothetical protein
MGSEPIEEEMPADREDLYWETQIVFRLFDILPSKWEGFSGQYMGKDLILLPVLFKEFKIEKYIRKYAWNIIPIIDSFIAEDVAQKIKRRTKKAPNGN